MVVTGELTSGAIGIMLTILGAAVAWWVKSDRQSTKFDVLLAQMRVDIETNRLSFTNQLTEMKSDAKAFGKSIDEVKLQLAAISAQQNMGNLFANLPEAMGRAMAQAVRDQRQRDRNNDRDAA